MLLQCNCRFDRWSVGRSARGILSRARIAITLFLSLFSSTGPPISSSYIRIRLSHRFTGYEPKVPPRSALFYPFRKNPTKEKPLHARIPSSPTHPHYNFSLHHLLSHTGAAPYVCLQSVATRSITALQLSAGLRLHIRRYFSPATTLAHPPFPPFPPQTVHTTQRATHTSAHHTTHPVLFPYTYRTHTNGP